VRCGRQIRHGSDDPRVSAFAHGARAAVAGWRVESALEDREAMAALVAGWLKPL